MSEPAYGFTATYCKSIVETVDAYKSAQLGPGSSAGKTHPWGGPMQRYLLLDDLCPTSPAAIANGDLISARAVRTEVAQTPAIFLRRLTAGRFKINGTTISTAATATEIQALFPSGTFVWGNGTDLIDDTGATITSSANAWFINFPDSTTTPTLPTLAGQGDPALVVMNRTAFWPSSFVETVHLFDAAQINQTSLRAGSIILAAPLPGFGPVVMTSAPERIWEGKLTSALAKATNALTGHATALVQIHEPDPASTSTPFNFRASALSPVTVISRDESMAGVVGAQCHFTVINGELRFTWMGCP